MRIVWRVAEREGRKKICIVGFLMSWGSWLLERVLKGALGIEGVDVGVLCSDFAFWWALWWGR